jgi:hypothetical protein
MSTIFVLFRDGVPVTWTSAESVQDCLENLIEQALSEIENQRVFIERCGELDVRIYTRQLFEWNTVEKLEVWITAKKLERWHPKDE